MKAGYDYTRIDVVQAHYWYYVNYHGGMHSREYARMCKIRKYYTPGSFERMPETYAASIIYNTLEVNAGYTRTKWIEDNSGTIIWTRDSL